jgi:hypothetical protein
MFYSDRILRSRLQPVKELFGPGHVVPLPLREGGGLGWGFLLPSGKTFVTFRHPEGTSPLQRTFRKKYEGCCGKRSIRDDGKEMTGDGPGWWRGAGTIRDEETLTCHH